MANRKFAVPRFVVKERVQLHWVVLFRMRLFMHLAFGYDPLILNFDQSPFHHNEVGSQNKQTLAVTGSVVPIVEGNNDVKSRWTANLVTQSRFSCGGFGEYPQSRWPAAECMFKAERDGSVDARLQAHLRNRGVPGHFTVTVAPKGSYCEQDVIEFLKKHLEPWSEGRDWRIMMMDDYSAHKTENVWNLCWSRGYVRIVHGGGVTPYTQTCDTDLNEHVRREYGAKESHLLLEKMRCGQVVPKLTHEECMGLMNEVWTNPGLHRAAVEGYKRVGQSIDLHGAEDALVCREAGVFWREETTDGKFENMRAWIDAELVEVGDEYASKGIGWNQRDVKRLITAYKPHTKTDRTLRNLGEDFQYDDIHRLHDESDGAASDGAESDGAASDGAAVAEGGPSVDNECDERGHGPGHEHEHNRELHALEDAPMELATLSAEQAEVTHKIEATIAGLHGAISGLQAIGHVRGAHLIECELGKEMRKLRYTVKESPAVADAFSRLRRAEDEGRRKRDRVAAEHAAMQRDATKAIADKSAAVADLRATKKKPRNGKRQRLSSCNQHLHSG